MELLVPEFWMGFAAGWAAALLAGSLYFWRRT
jgi:hypothetical protein